MRCLGQFIFVFDLDNRGGYLGVYLGKAGFGGRLRRWCVAI